MELLQVQHVKKVYMVDKMAFSKGKDNSENTVNNDNHKNNDILAFVKQNIRYFTAGALLIVLVLVLVNCGTPKNNDEGGGNVAATETESETEEAFEVDDTIPLAVIYPLSACVD